MVSKLKSREEAIRRFWSYVDKTDPSGCWVWIGALHSDGYGKLWWEGRHSYIAHRAAYEISLGDIPEGMCVCHKCDNPPCVNPDHLFLATHKDNMRDMVTKGRARGGSPKGTFEGERNPGVKISTEAVLAIRLLYEQGYSVAEISRRFASVSYSNIWLIVKRKAWTHI